MNTGMHAINIQFVRFARIQVFRIEFERRVFTEIRSNSAFAWILLIFSVRIL